MNKAYQACTKHPQKDWVLEKEADPTGDVHLYYFCNECQSRGIDICLKTEVAKTVESGFRHPDPADAFGTLWKLPEKYRACRSAQHPEYWFINKEDWSDGDSQIAYICPQCCTMGEDLSDVGSISGESIISATDAVTLPTNSKNKVKASLSPSQQVLNALIKEMHQRYPATLAPEPQHTSNQKERSEVYTKIKDILDAKFIETEKIARILSLAVEGKKNCILWGDAGHGKSEMVAAAIQGLGYSDDCFVMSFGEGMDEATLWGGLNFEKLEKESVLEYNPERSFLNHRIAIFEELFDAPPIVLLPLKDTLTARELRKGAQRFAMKTDTIIAITNRAPSEISEIGAAAHALIERFPLQLQVGWDDYSSDRYRSLFEKVHPKTREELRSTLADLIGKVTDDGGFISPRSAVHALETLMIAENGSDMQGDACFQALAYVPGFEKVVDGIEADLERNREIRVAKHALTNYQMAITQISRAVQAATDADTALQLLHHVIKLDESIQNIRIPDELTEHRDTLKKTAKALSDECMTRAYQKAVENTNGAINAVSRQLPQPD